MGMEKIKSKISTPVNGDMHCVLMPILFKDLRIRIRINK